MRKYIKPIIWGIIPITIVSLTIIYLLFRFGLIGSDKEVVSVEPGHNEEVIGFYPVIKVQFNEGLNPSGYSINIDPFINGSISIDKLSNSLLLRPTKRLSAGQAYNVIVKRKNREIFRWKFVTAVSSSDPDVLNEVDDYQSQYYPLIEFLPRVTNRYRIEYLDKNILGIYSNSPKNELEKEIVDWVTSVGVDPSTHSFEWFPIDDTPLNLVPDQNSDKI